jgi:CubicO group peptidase (beta-lactamase class C family)
VDSIFAEFAEEGSPGATVMVIRDGEVLHSAGYGAADLATGSPMLPSTPVRLGSVSKAFTAMAIVILEEKGHLGFDAPATEWVPELARFEGVTVRHLLNHTSGLPDYYDDESPLQEIAMGDGRASPLQNAEAVSVYETWGDPVFPPGQRFEYSNPGYEVLALIVERISGRTFAQFLDTEIFAPLGMTTAVVRELPSTEIPGRAIGYAPPEDGGGWRESDDHWGNWLVGAGGVYASVEDLYHWDQALYRWAETGERTEEAFAPTRLNDGTESEYGFGWNLSDLLDREAIHHNGGWVGFRTSLFRFPREGLTVIVLSNASAETEELALATASVFLDQD